MTNTCHSSWLTLRNHISAYSHLISDVGFIFHLTFSQNRPTQAKKSQFYILKSMERLGTWWNTCHSPCLTMRNNIPVIFPPDFWCGLHIPSHTSILGQKGGCIGQKEPILRPKKFGNGRNMMKYMSFTMFDHEESHTSHISTRFPTWASYSMSHFDFRPKKKRAT